MDYEKKYKEALETARKINSGEGVAVPPDWTSYEVIFPELKESEDERIVRCLLNYFNHVRYNGLDLKGTDVDEVIAWLEKQGEKVTNINGEDYGIDGLYHAIKILERTVGRVTGYQSDDGILEHKAAINAVKELYKKQGEKKPADKIEPKTLDANKKVDRVIGTADHIKTALDVLNKKGGEYEAHNINSIHRHKRFKQ